MMRPTPEMIEAAARAMYETSYKASWDVAFGRAKDLVRARVEKALKSALAAMWRPIGEAPKDGSRLFVHCGEYCTVAWRDNDMNDGSGAWTDGLVFDWGMEEMREILPVWFCSLSIFKDSK